MISPARTHLDEEPGGDKCQAAVLPVEAVVVGVEGKVVQVEESGQEGKKDQEKCELPSPPNTSLSWGTSPRVTQTH